MRREHPYGLTRRRSPYSFMRVVVLILVALLGCAPGRLPDDLARIADTAAVAIVGSDHATFVFPKETRSTFLWPPNSLDRDGDKFAWGITIVAGDTSFLPGVQVYRATHPASFSSLAEVVGARPAQLLFNPGGHMQMLDETASVGARVSDGRVIITLHGAAQIRRIFRDSPRTVRFGVVAPLEPVWRQDIVEVQYDRSLGSRPPRPD